MRWPAVAGLVVAFVGVAWMSLDPHTAGDLPAILLVVGGLRLLGSGHRAGAHDA